MALLPKIIFAPSKKTSTLREIPVEATLEKRSKPASPASNIAELSVDVYNSPNKITLIAPIAGIKTEEIQIKVSEDTLTIIGERKKPVDFPKDECHVEECFWGPFSRSLILPPYADINKIKASFQNGILIIEIPKLNNPKEKVIKISTQTRNS